MRLLMHRQRPWKCETLGIDTLEKKDAKSGTVLAFLKTTAPQVIEEAFSLDPMQKAAKLNTLSVQAKHLGCKAEVDRLIKAKSEEEKQIRQQNKTSMRPGIIEVRQSEVVQGYVNELERLQAWDAEKQTGRGLAELFADIMRGRVRYFPKRRNWMHFNGLYWELDIEGMEAGKAACDFAAAYGVFAGQADTKGELFKISAKLQEAKFRGILIQDAQKFSYISPDELDKDDLVINCQNGVLDLNTFELQPMDPAGQDGSGRMFSKVTAAPYIEGARSVLWERTIAEVMQDDTETMKYLQKVVGLGLTGERLEEAMYILYGETTRNGKSTVIETIAHALGGYAVTAQPGTFALNKFGSDSGIRSDLVRLNGVRLVCTSETKDGMQLDAALIKQLTGGDTITARNPYELEIQFKPKFTLVMNTNYLPFVSDITVFSSDRIHIIPFDRHFERHEQNKQLKTELLQDENLKGVFAWMVEGLRLYRKEGLEEPTRVKNALDQYKRQSDKIGLFLSDCFEEKKEAIFSAGDAYKTFENWCEQNGRGVDGKQNFFGKLRQRKVFRYSATINGKTIRNVLCGYEPKFRPDESGQGAHLFP